MKRWQWTLEGTSYVRHGSDTSERYEGVFEHDDSPAEGLAHLVNSWECFELLDLDEPFTFTVKLLAETEEK